MPLYNTDRQPSLSAWTSSSAQASLVLDQTSNHLFTNLDVISGKIVVRCAKDIAVNAIIVKLEGESRTRLVGQNHEERRQDPNVQLEQHKILYKTQTVFPPTEVEDSRGHAGKGVFTIPAGTHEYAWNFKLPFNNACYTPQTLLAGVQMGVSGRGFEMNKIPTRHVKTTLPPTLTGFPGEAEISYYVKATVQRQGLFKENPRAHQPFRFMPIESPRLPPTGELSFARHRHTFVTSKRAGKKSFFGMGAAKPADEEGPSFSVDMRLPKPSILTCNQPLPLSIVVTKLSAVAEYIYLQSLQIALIGTTKIRAHDLERTEQNSWIVMSKSNMGITAVMANDAEGTEITVDDTAWRLSSLPNTVAPSFATCNIARAYQVEVRAGFSCGGRTFDGSKPQHVVLTLRLDALVFSGIAPPKAALSRIIVTNDPANDAQGSQTTGSIVNLTDAKLPHTLQTPTTPASSSFAQQAPALPARSAEDALYADAPPSYEDAIATDLPPVDGYRPVYAPLPVVESAAGASESKAE